METKRQEIINKLKKLEQVNAKWAYELSNVLRLELAKIDAKELLNK